MIGIPVGFGLVIILTSTFGSQTAFSQPNNGTNTTTTASLLSAHVGAKIWVYANIEYSPGSAVNVPVGIRTCLRDGTWDVSSNQLYGKVPP